MSEFLQDIDLSKLDEHATELAHVLEQSAAIVFFGGAGTSTESGIPDFRSAGGILEEGEQFPHPPEVMLSSHFFQQDPELFYRFYRAKMIYPDAVPNAAHQVLAQLEQDGKLHAIVTQNIDGLHQAAGSREVWELHGSIHRNDCLDCGTRYPLAAVLDSAANVPRCTACGGMLKPDVVLYGESLDDAVIASAVERIRSADLLIVGGTSLMVQPAASFVRLATKAKLVLLNRSATSVDAYADAVYRAPMGALLERAYAKLHG
ncbi:NAD-dependent protein deacylase [Paenibacillus sp. 481]|uniref:NAD-dependent protein deacylase n=1 Tax=Paenibacillus sp. 481 TaxID=2835869 RepID=UPI001E64D397|nr:NAD-dependent protein deacylase [Paenibacillus sp. 481]UHA74271.1 NAD-dependent protein deacylase [Paenibacillus sp. 481]